MSGQRDMKDLIMRVRQQLEMGQRGSAEPGDDPEATMPGGAVSDGAATEQLPAGVAEPGDEEEVDDLSG